MVKEGIFFIVAAVSDFKGNITRMNTYNKGNKLIELFTTYYNVFCIFPMLYRLSDLLLYHAGLRIINSDFIPVYIPTKTNLLLI